MQHHRNILRITEYPLLWHYAWQRKLAKYIHTYIFHTYSINICQKVLCKLVEISIHEILVHHKLCVIISSNDINYVITHDKIRTLKLNTHLHEMLMINKWGLI